MFESEFMHEHQGREMAAKRCLGVVSGKQKGPSKKAECGLWKVVTFSSLERGEELC